MRIVIDTQVFDGATVVGAPFPFTADADRWSIGIKAIYCVCRGGIKHTIDIDKATIGV